MIVLFFGCSGSQVPISPPGDVSVDKQLLGDWIEIKNIEIQNTVDTFPDKMKVYQFNEYEYLIKYMVIDTSGTETLLIRAFTTPVNDALFANVQCLGCDDDNDYAFFRYLLTNDGILKVWPVKTEYYGDPMFTESSELFDYMLNHLDNDEIYDSLTQFKKEKKY